MKKAFSIITFLLALPLAIILIILGRIADRFNSYADISLIASRIPFFIGRKIRNLYYKGTLDHLGHNVVFQYGSFCQYSNIKIGNRALFGYYNAIGQVNIGDDVIVGGFVNFVSGTKQHSFENKNLTIREQKATGRKVIFINSDVWIGSNCVIAANVGARCVIGAGSILVKDADDNSIYAGNPAKFVKAI